MKAFILILVLTVMPVVLYLAGQPLAYVWAAWLPAMPAVFWFVFLRSPQPAERAKALSPVMHPQER